jgi:hypothetical protein
MINDSQQPTTAQAAERRPPKHAAFWREVRYFLLIAFLLAGTLGAWYFLRANWSYADFKKMTLGVSENEVKHQLNLMFFKRLSGDELADWKSYKSKASQNTGGYIQPAVLASIAELWRIPKRRILYGEFLQLGFDRSGHLCFKDVDEFMIAYPATLK